MRALLCLSLLSLLASCTKEAADCADDTDCADGQVCVDGTCKGGAGSCAETQLLCGGGCVDPSDDRDHCGACDARCAQSDCLGGACCPTIAPSSCANECVDTNLDQRHCGACGNVCGEGQACLEGTCCAAGASLCEGACRELQVDPFACGACDVVCPVGAECVEGACTACPEGMTARDCGGIEVCASDDDCMARVPAGAFLMGTNLGNWSDRPQHEVTLTAYRIDVLEVTQRQYRACMDAGVCTTPELLTDDREPDEPVTWVTWDQAVQYCLWAGKRLPSEAEWEKAARGTDERRWPWGDVEADVDCTRANFSWCGAERRRVGRRLGGASPYGALDMAGNAIEWVADWYARDTYAAGAVTDPLGPATGDAKIRRGGSFLTGIEEITTHHREDRVGPDHFDPQTGFRCAKNEP